MRTNLTSVIALTAVLLGSPAIVRAQNGPPVRVDDAQRVATFRYPPAMVAATHDGTRAAVPLPWDTTVLIVDAEADQTISRGSSGTSVGQFRTVDMVGWLGDTLWVADQLEFRVTVFSPYGTPTVRSPNGATRMARGRRVPLPLSDGSWTTVNRVQTADGLEPLDTWMRLASDWSAVDEIAPLATAAPRVRVSLGEAGAVVGGAQPFSYHHRYDLQNDFQRAVILRQSLDDPGSYQLVALDLTGKELFSTSRRLPPVPLDASAVDAVVDTYLGSGSFQRSGLPPDEVAQAVRAALQVPDYVPPATDLHVGADGWLWVKRADGASEASVWDVFDDEGQLRGVLQLDSTARGLDSAGPYLWYFARQDNEHTLFRARNPWK
jgi:hypothetical protein